MHRLRALFLSTALALATPSMAGPAPAADGDDGPLDAGLQRVMSVAERRHLLLRSGIGAAPADLLALKGLSRAEGIERVIAGLRTEPALPMPAWTREPPPHYHARESLPRPARRRFDRDRDRELGELRHWWTLEMLGTDSPQTERLVLFWHDLFATSYHATDRASLAMARQNATFRRLGAGSWETLLKAMIRDAALLDYLDADSNRAAAPNENLARELLELFTLGEGEYTERDVGEAARALSGHATADTAELAFRLHTWNHDDGDKVLFGERGRFDGDALIERALAQPAAARFLAARFWRAFVADAAPEPAWLERTADAFRASGHDIGTLYRLTLSSAAFWAPERRGAIVRSPLDLITGTARSLDYPGRHWRSLARWQADLGMALFAPPDVGGWREGLAFVTGGALLDRRRVLERLLFTDAGGLDDEAMSDEGMAGASMADEGMAVRDGATRPLLLRVAAENYRGAAELKVTLRAKGETLWRGPRRAVPGGHDTERDGRVRGDTDLPWQELRVAVPGALLARSDAVGVGFVNDAAGADGDRNLYVDGLDVDGVWSSAADGVQRGDCPPEDPGDAGRLYCAGTVIVPLEGAVAAPDPADPPAWRAAGARLRWADTDEVGGRRVARIALDDAVTPDGAFHRLQFLLRTAPDAAAELQFNTFDCVPDCIRRWPDCAWRDEGFPASRTLAVPLDGRGESARDRCHVEALDAAERERVAVLARSLPALLAIVRESPPGQRERATLDALIAMLSGSGHSGAVGGADDVNEVGDSAEPSSGTGETFAIDAAWAPRPARPSVFVPPSPRVADVDELAAALAADGLALADLLLAGWPDATLAAFAPRPGEPATETLRRIVRDPAFQVR